MSYQIDPERIVWRNMGEEVVILDLQSGYYYGLNKTAALIWNRLTESKSSDVIGQEMAAVYGIPLKQAQNDDKAAIEELAKDSLILSPKITLSK